VIFISLSINITFCICIINKCFCRGKGAILIGEILKRFTTHSKEEVISDKFSPLDREILFRLPLLDTLWLSDKAHAIKQFKKWSFMLTATLITLVTLLERLLASGTLAAGLSALFKKALVLLGAY
jgi:hypothetical protein